MHLDARDAGRRTVKIPPVRRFRGRGRERWGTRACVITLPSRRRRRRRRRATDVDTGMIELPRPRLLSRMKITRRACSDLARRRHYVLVSLVERMDVKMADHGWIASVQRTDTDS